jgi:serine/threonine-protein kinase
MLVKLLDFGLAKFYEQRPDAAQARLTREGALFGTPAYMSPEQAKGQGEVDHRADLWALGCIVYECLTGTTVWNVDQGVAMILAQIAGAPIPKPSKLRPDLPPSFDQWFAKALERDPNKRFQTAKELAETLATALKPATSVPPPAWRQSSAPSAEENALIDELVKSHPPPAEPVHATQGANRTAEQVAVEPGASSRPGGAGRAVGALLGVSALALGGYAVWFYVLHPPSRVVAQPATTVSVDAPSASAAPAPPPRDDSSPLETEGYAKHLSKAQELLAQGKGDAALVELKEAFNEGGSGVARSMLSHAAVAIPQSGGKCKTVALGRPRPFERTTPSSRPDVAVTSAGTIVAWVDNQQDAAHRQGFTVLVDESLRRVSPARLVTPEAGSVRLPQLVPARDKLILVYWDDGSEPGVYARLLESDGRISGPTRRISSSQRHEFYPSAALGEDGSVWVVWEEEVDDSVQLFARHLSAELEPLGEPVRLTAFGPGRDGHGAQATRPSLSVTEGELDIAAAVERDKKRRIVLLQITSQDPGLTSGVGKPDGAPKKKSEDRSVGRLVPVTSKDGRFADPRLTCDKDGCFVVWNDEKGGALASYVDRRKGQAIWHREFARGAFAPAVSPAPHGAMVAYFEGSRVKLAAMTRDGVDPGSTLAKVGGIQPFPAIARGREPGQWYVSWRDFESGHLEAYVVRAQCQ